MLLSSILRFLDQYPRQRKVAEKPQVEPYEREAGIQAEKTSGLKRIEMEIAAAAGLLRPFSGMPYPGMPLASGPSLEDLIRAVSKFEESGQSRVVDVFE
jgi:hypothetical protein